MVHPHMRGEDGIAKPTQPQAAGSPPHAWGRLHTGQARRPSWRFTPTCVGKTARSPSCGSGHPVHPHMRGEDQYSGSKKSSRMRFTPTCVGKTSIPARRNHHVCGSPPHAWGRRADTSLCNSPSRFTPTCVGKTIGATLLSTTISVHPHMRGEDTMAYSIDYPLGGSPPHAWGRRGRDVVWHNISSVHPHMRGEDSSCGRHRLPRCGSPPHAWGRQGPEPPGQDVLRFTPTCVGKTR